MILWLCANVQKDLLNKIDVYMEQVIVTDQFRMGVWRSGLLKLLRISYTEDVVKDAMYFPPNLKVISENWLKVILQKMHSYCRWEYKSTNIF